MDTAFIDQATPVTMSGDFTTKEATKLTMQCHDRFFKSVTIFSGIGEKLFTVDSKGHGLVHLVEDTQRYLWQRNSRPTSFGVGDEKQMGSRESDWRRMVFVEAY
jgi:hypothetical protein